jgi:hypothetical protein
MPCGPGQDALPATPAAAEPQAGLGHVQALRQGVYVDVGLVGAGLAVAMTARTPFSRMLAKVIGGPGLLRMACAA